MEKRTTNPNVVFFDGTCVLCNSFADFLIARDKKGALKLAPLQGETALRLLTPDQRRGFDSILFLSQGRVLRKSDAILAICSFLPGPQWILLNTLGRLVPHALRDGIYDFMALRRHRWFGTRDSCRVPTPAESEHLWP